MGQVHVVITEVFNLQREITKQKLTLSSTPAGTTIGLKDNEWGQIGVIIIAGTFGWIIEAPAAAAYAVLPVGVETMTPVKGAKISFT